MSHLLSLHLLDNIGITRVGDGQAANSKVFTASGTQVNVGSTVVVDAGLTQHSKVLDFTLSEWWDVARDQDELGLSSSQALEHGLVTQSVLSTLHDEGQATVKRSEAKNEEKQRAAKLATTCSTEKE